MNRPISITNITGMKLILIPQGTFKMGSPECEEMRDDNETQHQVTISNDYYLGVTVVTQGQYEKVMGTTRPSFFHEPESRKSDISMYPVENVPWEYAFEFCKKLSDLPEEKKAGRVYRLPTEAEWEYACRAGSKNAYSFEATAESLGDYAWYGMNSESTIHPVGTKKPNPWGLYDMHGNVWEWCSDWYDDYPEGAAIDPTGPIEGSYRVFRGGSYSFGGAYCRSAFRYRNFLSRRYTCVGFRVALSSFGIPK